MIPDQALHGLMAHKNPKQALERCEEFDYEESWAICDGAVIIYDLGDPPSWLPERDEDGNSISRET